MASCDLDYRFQTNSSESMDYEDSDSDDDNKLQIVESGTPGMSSASSSGSSAARLPRHLVRSLSAVESVREDYQLGASTASDAVESLLLLGQGPVLNEGQETQVSRMIQEP